MSSEISLQHRRGMSGTVQQCPDRSVSLGQSHTQEEHEIVELLSYVSDLGYCDTLTFLRPQSVPQRTFLLD